MLAVSFGKMKIYGNMLPHRLRKSLINYFSQKDFRIISIVRKNLFYETKISLESKNSPYCFLFICTIIIFRYVLSAQDC